MRVAAVETALPPYRYEQEEITEAFARMCRADERLLRRFHAATRVSGRALALPLEEYGRLDGFTAANTAYINAAVDLGERAMRGALKKAGLGPADVDHLFMCSSTGLATPSLDAKLLRRVGMRPDVKRIPVFGLVCVAGAVGLARVNDHLLGRPGEIAVLLCIELCSLTVQRSDTSTANLVASALFGDGAAAVVAVGDACAGLVEAAGPAVVDSRSRLYPDSERLMGWQVGSHGFRIVLAADLVDVVGTTLVEDVRRFLSDHGLTPEDVATWVCHPGGPKVIETISGALGLPPDALDMTWRSLREAGNMSSVSVLNVLERTIAERRGEPGDPGLLLALGPGFSSELVLLRW